MNNRSINRFGTSHGHSSRGNIIQGVDRGLRVANLTE